MKKITFAFTCSLLFALAPPTVFAQTFDCVNQLFISLDVDGHYTMFPEDILSLGDLTGHTVTLSKSEYNCDDLGADTVSMSIFLGEDLVHYCEVPLVIEDKVSPIARCKNNPTIELDGNGEHQISSLDLDNGSSDGCGPLTFTFSPANMSCSSPNPTVVTMVVTDGSGNSSSCTSTVSWIPYGDPTESLACNDLVIVSLALGQEVEVTMDMMLAGGPYGCPNQYFILLEVDGEERPDRILTSGDSSSAIVCHVIDLNTGVTCWGNMDVVVHYGCNSNFTVCDTECHTASMGDCNSGHTDEDHVEWPCDIVIETTCQDPDINVTPHQLFLQGFATAADTAPALTNLECNLIGTAYYDEVFLTDEGKRVERTWAIIDWETTEIWEYEQTIFINIESVNICDTEPWNAPLGDCTSGHTDTDDIEWPADITVSTPFVDPLDLEVNPDIHVNDVRPLLSADCDGAAFSFNDVFISLNDSIQLVQRTWTVSDSFTTQTWAYVQHITVLVGRSTGMICVMRESLEPIPGVTLVPGAETDNTGCFAFADNNGVIVTPFKDSPITSGVNIADKILLAEHLLGISTLSAYQQIAADINRSGALSTIDYVLLDQIIAGTIDPVPTPVWKFFESQTQASFVDITNDPIAHKFIGVKLGDIDNSFSLPATSNPIRMELTIKDEVLNKKEEYDVPIYVSKNTRISGFTLRINGDAAQLQYLNVSAPLLPGFNAIDHVHINNHELTISWIAPNEYLASGITLPEGSLLCNIHLEPGENAILNETFKLETNYDNVMKETNEPEALEIAFSWDDLIISGVFNPSQARHLKFYPNPADQEIHLIGFDPLVRGVVNIVDGTGRHMMTQSLQSSLDIRTLEHGLYYITVTLDSGEHFIAPIMKMKS